MRKFIPRLLNVICFILALLIIIPFYELSWFQIYISERADFLKFFYNVYEFIYNNSDLKLFYIPVFMWGISFLAMLIAAIDRKGKKHRNESSYPLSNLSLAPLYYFGIASCINAIIRLSFNKGQFFFNEHDYFGLGKLLTSVPPVDYIYGLIIFGFLIVIQVILALSIRRTRIRNIGGKFLTWLLFFIFSFISFKGVTDGFKEFSSLINIITFNKDIVPYEYHIESFGNLMGYYVSFALLALYIIIALIRKHVNDKRMNEIKKSFKNNKEFKEEATIGAKQNFQIADDGSTIINPLYAVPRPEEVIETQIEEKTVVKQVVYEPNDLDQLFNTEFNFKYCSMIKGNDYTDYFVNKTKFLTLSNKNRCMSFRLELDKAIRLIIQYPLIGKDKYENHKIWFKIEDIGVLSQEVVISIIKDAYSAVLNND